MTRYGFQEAEIDSEASPLSLVGGGAAMNKVLEAVRRVAPTNASVLLLGEGGCGQENIANALHQWSRRSSRPFVRLSCGALSESPFFSELFGDGSNERGLSSAEDDCEKLESTRTGTLLLENIQALPVVAQTRLAEFIRKHQFVASNDESVRTNDVRFVSTATQALEQDVEAGKFDRTLYYQLNVIPIEIPPLRQRRDCLFELVNSYLECFANRNERFVSSVHVDAMRALQEYHWPGNLAELQSYMERAVVLAETDELTLDLFPDCIANPQAAQLANPGHPSDLGSLTKDLVQLGVAAADAKAKDLHSRVVDRVEKELISQVLEACDFVQTKAATRLGINRNTLHKKMKDYKLDGLGQ